MNTFTFICAVRVQVRDATSEALRARANFVTIGFTESGLIAWIDGKPAFKGK